MISKLLLCTLAFVAAAVDAPTIDELANARYEGIYDEPVALKDGRWEGEPFVPGAASRPAVGLVQDFRLTGDLDGDGSDESVVLLWESSGGSGTYNYIAVVGRRGREIINLGTALVGDRVQIRAARIAEDKIELEVVQAGPGDAACCPSQKATRTWVLAQSELKEEAPILTGTLSLGDLAGREWVLTHLSRDEPAPAEPEITLAFEGDRVSGTSGCNRFFSNVRDGDMPGEVTIGPVGGTRMACPEDVMNLENRYLEALAGVESYSFLAGRLALTARVKDSFLTMLFTPRKESSN